MAADRSLQSTEDCNKILEANHWDSYGLREGTNCMKAGARVKCESEV